MAKQRGDHGGAHLRQQMTRWTAVAAHGGSSGLGRQWWLNVGVLQLQEDVGTLHEDILILLSASIAASNGGS
jgi:hypothetical protein